MATRLGLLVEGRVLSSQKRDTPPLNRDIPTLGNSMTLQIVELCYLGIFYVAAHVSLSARTFQIQWADVSRPHHSRSLDIYFSWHAVGAKYFGTTNRGSVEYNEKIVYEQLFRIP